MSPGPTTPFLRILELNPGLLQQMLSSIMNTIMFENYRNQWSMSRPLLGLVLLNEEVRREGEGLYSFISLSPSTSTLRVSENV